MSLQKTDVFFGGADDEILRHESLDEYVEHHLDGQAPTLPEEVEVIEFRRKQLPADLEYLRPLEHALESLDEDYGNHVDGTGFEPTERMKEAEAAFLRVVRDEYVPWACEQGGSPIKVNVKEWIKEHKPWRSYESAL